MSNKGMVNHMMREYLEIPLATESIIMSLSNVQAGRLFQATLLYVFENKKPDFSDDAILKNAFIVFIRQCKRHGEIGDPEFIATGYTETFDDYEE